jgi:hypothetical protein
VGSVRGAWGAVVLGLLALGGCTRHNPAFLGVTAEVDAGDDQPPASTPPDGPASPEAAAPDHGPLSLDEGPPADDPLTLDAAAPDRTVEPALDVRADSGLTSALVAHWPLDEGTGTTGADATALGNTVVLHNGPTWVATGLPRALLLDRAALSFDGQDDFAEITCKTIPANEAPKSLSVWFKATAPAALPIRNLIALTNEALDGGIQLGLHEGRVSAWFYGDLEPMVWSDQLVDGEWHHAAYTYDGSVHRVYYDGVSERSRVRVPKTAPITRTRLGTYSAPEEMFRGVIDDVRVYARALTPAEVAALAAGQ